MELDEKRPCVQMAESHYPRCSRPRKNMPRVAAEGSEESSFVDAQRGFHASFNSKATPETVQQWNNGGCEDMGVGLAEKKMRGSNRRPPKRRRNSSGGIESLSLVAQAAKKGKENSIFSSEKVRACTECGKEFSSWKALFGHMRCHPERQWRGILPPQSVRQQREMMNHSNSNIAASSSSSPLHIQQKLHKAQMDAETQTDPHVVTASNRISDKRSKYDDVDDESGTESIEGAYIKAGNDDQKKEEGEKKNSRAEEEKEREIREQREMAHCLVMLSSATTYPYDFQQPEQQCQENDDGSEAEEEEAAYSRNGNGETQEAGEGDSVESDTDIDMGIQHLRGEEQAKDHSTDEFTDITRDKTPYEGGGAIHGLKPKNFGITATSFECGTCKKVFRSHQALGGHRASHKKVKGCFAKTADLEEDEEEPLQVSNFMAMGIGMKTFLEERMNNMKRAKNNGSDSVAETNIAGHHQCSICSKVFSTGQALGGHKRCHWNTFPTNTILPNSEVTRQTSLSLFPKTAFGLKPYCNADTTHPKPGTLYHQPPKRKTAQFLDLNKPAPLEDDNKEEDDGGVDVKLQMCSDTLLEMKIAGESLTLSSCSSCPMPLLESKKNGSNRSSCFNSSSSAQAMQLASSFSSF